jgi:hypothetical protein
MSWCSDFVELACLVILKLCRARLVASSRSGSDEPVASTSTSVGSAAADRSQFNQIEWAHELSRPEPGCLLLAHPYMFRERQRYFYQAVILLLDHGPEGSYGIILNRPTQYKVSILAGYLTLWGTMLVLFLCFITLLDVSTPPACHRRAEPPWPQQTERVATHEKAAQCSSFDWLCMPGRLLLFPFCHFAQY